MTPQIQETPEQLKLKNEILTKLYLGNQAPFYNNPMQIWCRYYMKAWKLNLDSDLELDFIHDAFTELCKKPASVIIEAFEAGPGMLINLAKIMMLRKCFMEHSKNNPKHSTALHMKFTSVFNYDNTPLSQAAVYEPWAEIGSVDPLHEGDPATVLFNGLYKQLTPEEQLFMDEFKQTNTRLAAKTREFNRIMRKMVDLHHQNN